jgi:hypothetical protein
MADVGEEGQPSKPKTLSSNPSTAPHQKKDFILPLSSGIG